MSLFLLAFSQYSDAALMNKGSTFDFDPESSLYQLCGNNMISCVQEQWENEEGFEQDEELNVSLLIEKCEKKIDRSCLSIAYLYSSADFSADNLNKSIFFSRRSCEQNDEVGCLLLGMLYLQSQSLTESIIPFSRACDLNEKHSCLFLSEIYFKGELVKKDINKSISFLTRSCEIGLALGCAELGGFYERGSEVERDTEKAVSFYEKSCGMGFLQRCHGLAYIYKKYQKFSDGLSLIHI